MREGRKGKGVAEIFEHCWDELLRDYGEKRILPVWCSEADIQLHLANKLLDKLPPDFFVHRELPIPLESGDLLWDLFFYGTVKRPRKKGTYIVSDIAIIRKDFNPHLLAELKFDPITWGFACLQATKKMKRPELVQDALEKDIEYLKRREEYGPTSGQIKFYLKNVGKLIAILNDFEEKERTIVEGRMCIVQEIYPELDKTLKEEIKKYNPPSQFKLLVEYFNMQGILEKVLREVRR